MTDVCLGCPCAAQVEVMQRELQDLQPILAHTAKEVEDMMVVIHNDKKWVSAGC